jgi:hypothetical protein
VSPSAHTSGVLTRFPRRIHLSRGARPRAFVTADMAAATEPAGLADSSAHSASSGPREVATGQSRGSGEFGARTPAPPCRWGAEFPYGIRPLDGLSSISYLAGFRGSGEFGARTPAPPCRWGAEFPYGIRPLDGLSSIGYLAGFRGSSADAAKSALAARHGAGDGKPAPYAAKSSLAAGRAASVEITATGTRCNVRARTARVARRTRHVGMRDTDPDETDRRGPAQLPISESGSKPSGPREA